MISKAVIESFVGAVDWFEEFEGHCECPGQHLHITKARGEDCTIYIEDLPLLCCVHSECSEVIADFNRQLRGAHELRSSALNNPDRKGASNA